MFAFHVLKPRQGRGEAQFFRIGRVDAGHQRLHEPLERFSTEPPTNETGETFVAAIFVTPRDEILPRQPQLAEWTENRRRRQLAKCGSGP